MTDQLEFEERDIWGGSQSGDEAAPSGIDSEREGTEEESRKRGASSSSSSDSELKEQKDQNIKAFRGEAGTSTDSVSIAFRQGSLRGRPRSRRGSSDDPGPAASKLGTSMPINIPMMRTRRQKEVEEEKKPDKAATFIPPHMLEQSDAKINFSLSSASAAKREKLLQRNAILRRTGFIEAGTRMPGGGKGALPELLDPLNRRMLPIKESHLEQSALSAALGSPNGKQEA